MPQRIRMTMMPTTIVTGIEIWRLCVYHACTGFEVCYFRQGDRE